MLWRFLLLAIPRNSSYQFSNMRFRPRRTADRVWLLHDGGGLARILMLRLPKWRSRHKNCLLELTEWISEKSWLILGRNAKELKTLLLHSNALAWTEENDVAVRHHG